MVLPQDTLTETSSHRRRMSARRLGFLLACVGGLVLLAAFFLPELSPAGGNPSLWQQMTAPRACQTDCGGGPRLGGLIAVIWLLVALLLTLIAGSQVARRSLDEAGTAFASLGLLLVSILAAVLYLVMFVLAAQVVVAGHYVGTTRVQDWGQLLDSTLLAPMLGLGLAVAGGVLTLREPPP